MREVIRMIRSVEDRVRRVETVTRNIPTGESVVFTLGPSPHDETIVFPEELSFADLDLVVVVSNGDGVASAGVPSLVSYTSTGFIVRITGGAIGAYRLNYMVLSH